MTGYEHGLPERQQAAEEGEVAQKPRGEAQYSEHAAREASSNQRVKRPASTRVSPDGRKPKLLSAVPG
jgi:hypothetical protein